MVELSFIRDLVAIFGVIAGFSYYVLTVRASQRNQQLQLETRQAQLYNSLWNQSCNNPEFQKSFLRFQAMNWSNYEEYIKLCPPNDADSENTMAVWSIALFFEGLGPIMRDGLIDMKYLANSTIGWFLRTYWEKISIIADTARIEWNLPTCWDETEALYNMIMEYREKTH